MNKYPTITIVTPNLNGAKFLEKTILSVISQDYPNLEYIVIDGGSTDGSIEIIEKYAASMTYWESKPDNGLYHAIQKGFAKSTGEIMGWINSDDILCMNSLFSIAEIFFCNTGVNWIQGYPTVIDDQNRIVYHRPAVYSKLFFYLKDYKDGRFIQQESTFWTRSLWNKAGGHVSQEYKYAGDFELWIRFFKHAPLYITSTILGSFRLRNDGQMSVLNYQNYHSECDQIIDETREFLSEKEKRSLMQIRRLRKLGSLFPMLLIFSGYKNLISKFMSAPEIIDFNFHNYSY